MTNFTKTKITEYLALLEKVKELGQEIKDSSDAETDEFSEIYDELDCMEMHIDCGSSFISARM